jgi:HD-like signal output (HDOD) protein
VSLEEVTGKLRQQCEEVLRLTQALEPDLREIADITQKNKELTERLLRAVNSVGSGLQHSISDVQHALAYLGTKKVSEIVGGMLPAIPPPPDISHQPIPQELPRAGSQTQETEAHAKH